MIESLHFFIIPFRFLIGLSQGHLFFFVSFFLFSINQESHFFTPIKIQSPVREACPQKLESKLNELIRNYFLFTVQSRPNIDRISWGILVNDCIEKIISKYKDEIRSLNGPNFQYESRFTVSFLLIRIKNDGITRVKLGISIHH